MRPGLPHLSLAILLAASAVSIPGCGGHAVVRPATDPGTAPPPPGTQAPPEAPPSPPAPKPGREPAPAPSPERPQPEGIHHRLERGETLYALSKAYGVPVATLIRVNHIADPASIPAGTEIFIPGATAARPVSVPAAAVSGPTAALLAWPLAGAVTSGFGPRGRRHRHTGIDIDGTLGQRIRAAADGRVIRAGRASGYGLMVVIDHGNGLTTLYGHASRLLVFKGERVRGGQPIAKVGSSGNARGSHLHFEVRRNDLPVDPKLYLPTR